jgi:hypothetical protein
MSVRIGIPSLKVTAQKSLEVHTAKNSLVQEIQKIMTPPQLAQMVVIHPDRNNLMILDIQGRSTTPKILPMTQVLTIRVQEVTLLEAVMVSELPSRR